MLMTLTLAIIASSGLESALAAGDAAKGKVIYEKHCVLCHGPQGKGDGPTGKVLIPPATDFTGTKSKRKSEKELLVVIREGKPGTGMVAWKGQLSDQDIGDVLAYVLTLRK
jgi:mono/diheme cytochrome c family protein